MIENKHNPDKANLLKHNDDSIDELVEVEIENSHDSERVSLLDHKDSSIELVEINKNSTLRKRNVASTTSKVPAAISSTKKSDPNCIIT